MLSNYRNFSFIRTYVFWNILNYCIAGRISKFYFNKNYVKWNFFSKKYKLRKVCFYQLKTNLNVFVRNFCFTLFLYILVGIKLYQPRIKKNVWIKGWEEFWNFYNCVKLMHTKLQWVLLVMVQNGSAVLKFLMKKTNTTRVCYFSVIKIFE